MNERFASVWDALPPDLGDTDPAIESLLPDCRKMADRLGYSLVLTRDWWHLTAPGIRCRFGDLADVAGYLRKAAKRALPGLAGADGATALDSPETTLQAVLKACPIGNDNWTVSRETFTPTRDTNDVELSNES